MFPNGRAVVSGRTSEYHNDLGLRHTLAEKFEFLFSKPRLLN
jgi:hypothetical protein